MLADKEHLRWTTKVANAQTELAKQELTVALKAAEAAKNRTSSEGKNVAFDASLREKANADLEIADQLTEATGKLVNNNNSGLVKAAQMAHETKVNKHTTQAQKATADFKEAAAAALNSQHKFDAADAESEMSLHAAADAAAGYGQADTAERVALEKLKSMLPAEEAQEADSAAAKARAAVATSPKSLEGSGEEEALWAEQNAKELEQAHMGAPKRASTSVATTLGESQAVNHERHTSQLGKMLQKAQLSLDVDDEEDAIDAANGIKVNLPNDKGGVMLSLEKTLNDAITSS